MGPKIEVGPLLQSALRCLAMNTAPDQGLRLPKFRTLEDQNVEVDGERRAASAWQNAWGARTSSSNDLEFRIVRAHEIDIRLRTFDRARFESFRKHVSLVERRLLIDQPMLIFIGMIFVSYTGRDPLCPGWVQQHG